MSGIRDLLKDKKASGGALILIIGIAFIVAGFIIGLYTFSVTREQANEPDVPEMFSTFTVGLIVAIILVVIGLLIILLGAKSG